jgi:hypothetical protein
MSFRSLLACLLTLTLSACGAGNSTLAENQSTGPNSPQARQPAAPADESQGQTPVELASFSPQTGEAAASGENAANEDSAADEATEGNSNESESTSTDTATDIVLLARAISELRTSIDDLREQNQKIMTAVGVDNIRAELELDDPAQPSTSADSLVDIVMDLRDTVAELRIENEAFAKLLKDQTTVLKPIPATPTQGTLTVENNTESDQYVWINGVGRWVWANTTSKVTVPVGEVTTKISGEEQKTWEITAPKYEEHIEFVRPPAE